ncbi:MAG TPA: heme-binding protein [Vineibacter sp.]|nr:heme-binding protein [Vineibacter sp.]
MAGPRPLSSSLSLAAASSIADSVITLAREEKLLPLVVAVLDSAGSLVAYKREDGAGLLRFDIATGKAWGALGMGLSSRTIRDRMKDNLGFQNALAAASGGRFVPVPGGVLILDANGAVIGAVGISGDTSDKDEYCAITAIQRAGFASDPPQPHPNWRG